jgi:hypothetical protein
MVLSLEFPHSLRRLPEHINPKPQFKAPPAKGKPPQHPITSKPSVRSKPSEKRRQRQFAAAPLSKNP